MPGMKEKIKNTKESVNDSIAGMRSASDRTANTRGYNKMLSSTSLPTNVNNPFGSFIKKGRFNILPGDVAFEFNTYKNWAPFSILMEPANFDGFSSEGAEEHGDFSQNGTNVDSKGRLINTVITQPGGSNMGIIGRKSLFNPMTAVNDTNEARVSANAPLLDESVLNKRRFEMNSCSIKDLVAATQSGRLGVATYSYADFMYCKYLGKCSNEYLITLRRFAYPPGDHINTINPDTEKDTQKHVNDIGRMVTWMGAPGNEMSNILKYSVKIPYEKFEAHIEEIDQDKTTNESSILGNLMNLGNRRNLELIESGMAGEGSLKMLSTGLGMLPGKTGGKIGGLIGDPPYSSAEWRKNFDRNKSYGPLDVITETYKRRGADKGGLEFNQEIQLRFDYELRAYDGINGRAAMLDLIGNILATCYTTGKFWGGSQQFLGASQSNSFANLPLFMSNKYNGGGADGLNQTPGDFAAYSRNLASSLGMIFGVNDKEDAVNHMNTETKTYKSKKSKSDRKSQKNEKDSSVVMETKSLFGDVGQMIKNAGSALGSLLWGGLINKLGRPQVLAVNSLLSDAPTGLWHLTIGNPKAPIMSMGNMIIDQCEIEHKGPLGIDGFPTGISVMVKLIHGKPRENTGIERMYLQGDYRIYSPMGDKLLKMYWGAPTLASLAANQAYEKEIKAGKISQAEWVKSKYYLGDIAKNVSSPDAKDKMDVVNLKRYFGTVAGLENSATYITNEGMEALFGSTDGKSARANDNHSSGLDAYRGSLVTTDKKERQEEEKKKKEKLENDYKQYSGEVATYVGLWGSTADGFTDFRTAMGADNKMEITAIHATGNNSYMIDFTKPDWFANAEEWIKGQKEDESEEMETLSRLKSLRTAMQNRDDSQKALKDLSSNNTPKT